MVQLLLPRRSNLVSSLNLNYLNQRVLVSRNQIKKVKAQTQKTVPEKKMKTTTAKAIMLSGVHKEMTSALPVMTVTRGKEVPAIQDTPGNMIMAIAGMTVLPAMNKMMLIGDAPSFRAMSNMNMTVLALLLTDMMKTAGEAAGNLLKIATEEQTSVLPDMMKIIDTEMKAPPADCRTVAEEMKEEEAICPAMRKIIQEADTVKEFATGGTIIAKGRAIRKMSTEAKELPGMNKMIIVEEAAVQMSLIIETGTRVNGRTIRKMIIVHPHVQVLPEQTEEGVRKAIKTGTAPVLLPLQTENLKAQNGAAGN